jgi:hypothetical protein
MAVVCCCVCLRQPGPNTVLVLWLGVHQDPLCIRISFLLSLSQVDPVVPSRAVGGIDHACMFFCLAYLAPDVLV